MFIQIDVLKEAKPRVVEEDVEVALRECGYPTETVDLNTEEGQDGYEGDTIIAYVSGLSRETEAQEVKKALEAITGAVVEVEILYGAGE